MRSFVSVKAFLISWDVNEQQRNKNTANVFRLLHVPITPNCKRTCICFAFSLNLSSKWFGCLLVLFKRYIYAETRVHVCVFCLWYPPVLILLGVGMWNPTITWAFSLTQLNVFHSQESPFVSPARKRTSQNKVSFICQIIWVFCITCEQKYKIIMISGLCVMFSLIYGSIEMSACFYFCIFTTNSFRHSTKNWEKIVSCESSAL